MKKETLKLNKKQKEIYNKVHKKSDMTLFMKAVPLPTKKLFQEYADREFAGSYGFALKALLDFYMGAIPAISEKVELAMVDFDERLKYIENKSSDKEKPYKEVTMCDGTKVRLPK